MKLIFVFSLLNSIGTVVMWLMLGPHYSNLANGMLSMGTIGMIRQLAFITGTTLAGAWADEGQPLEKSIWIEVIQLVFGLGLLVPIVFFPETIPPILFPVWSCFRFGLGGAAFVLGFRLLSFGTVNLSSSAILHLLTTQGAVLFGAAISFTLPSFSSQPFLVALALDCLTTAAYLVVLIKLKNSSFDQTLPTTLMTVSARLKYAMGSFWERDVYPYNWIQLFALVGLSGFAVTSFHFSQVQTLFEPSSAYPACSFVYGLLLWIGGISIQRGIDPYFAAIYGAVLLILSAIVNPLIGEHSSLLIVQFLLYLGAFSMLLHGTNSLVLANVPSSKAGTVRAGMLLFMSIIFAVGELGFGYVLQMGFGTALINVTRLISGFIVLTVLFRLYSRRKILFGTTASLLLLVNLWVPQSFGASENKYIRPVPIPPGTFDTKLPPSETDAFVYKLIFDTLVRYGKNGEILGGLAKTWGVIEGGKAIELQLHSKNLLS